MADASSSSSMIETIATQLLTDLDETLSPSSSGKKSKRIVTATDLYRLGLVLFNLSSSSSSYQRDQPQRVIVENVRDTSRTVIQELPENIRKGLFDDLLEALQQLGKQHRDEQYHELASALESFVGIWWLLGVTVKSHDGDAAQHRRQRLQQRWLNELETSMYLIELYQKPHFSPQQTCRKLILEFLSLVWLSPIQKEKPSSAADTAVSASSSSTKHLEDFLTVLNALHEDDSIWEDLVTHHQEQPDLPISWRRELVESLTQNNSDDDDATQRDYLSSLLLYEKTEPQKTSILMPPTPTRPTAKAAKSTPAKKKDPMQDRIDQVRAVIPDFGEGFVEIALSLYQGDAQRAISALLEPELPPGLQYVDRTLPRRKNPNAMAAMIDDDNDEDAQMAKQVTKKALQETERRAAAEAAAIYYVLKTDPDVSNTANKETAVVHHDEYDDEYDDQWDDLGGTAGADDGLYDRLDSGGGAGAGAGDYQAVLAYNRAVKQAEDEQSFWDEQRNTNRAAAKPNNNGTAASSGAGKNYRGPDKIKGGRVPDQRGGRGGGGRGSGGGRGNRGAKGKNDNADGSGGSNSGGRGGGGPNKTTTSDSNMPNQRHKANKLASRRERQKQSMNKRSGGM